MKRISAIYNLNRFAAIFSIFSAFFFQACVESMVNPPDKIAPVLEILSPKSNDTIAIGKNLINFKSSDDQKITFYEIYLDGKFIPPNIPVSSGGEKPSLYLNIDSSLVNKRVSYYIKAYDASNSAQSEVMTNILVVESKSPPSAPVNLTLTRISSSIVNLLWADSSSNEDGFEIWRKKGEGEYQKIQTLPKNAISTNDSTLMAESDYYYKVRAFNRFGFSESKQVSRLSTGYLPAPDMLKGWAYGTGRIELNWSDNSEGELGFIVERRTASASAQFKQIALTGANTTNYEDKNGLSASTSYIYRVCALGQLGKSEWSPELQISTLSYEVNPPSDLKAGFNQTSGAVVLQWKDNSIYEIETRIERKSAEEKSFSEIGKAGTDITTYTDQSVQRNKTYIYRIRGYMNDGNFSDYSAEVTIVVPGT